MKELNELVELAEASKESDIWLMLPGQLSDITGVDEAAGVFIEECSPEKILAIADAFRALEQRAEAAEELNNHLELAVRKAEGVIESMRRRAEDAENKLLFTRPAPAINLAELVPPRLEEKDTDYQTLRDEKRGYNACLDDILRNIEEANK